MGPCGQRARRKQKNRGPAACLGTATCHTVKSKPAEGPIDPLSKHCPRRVSSLQACHRFCAECPGSVAVGAGRACDARPTSGASPRICGRAQWATVPGERAWAVAGRYACEVSLAVVACIATRSGAGRVGGPAEQCRAISGEAGRGEQSARGKGRTANGRGRCCTVVMPMPGRACGEFAATAIQL